jgi:hypothetical protein
VRINEVLLFLRSKKVSERRLAIVETFRYVDLVAIHDNGRDGNYSRLINILW